MPPKVELRDSDQKKLVEILRTAASTAGGSSRLFFEMLIEGTSWPREWKIQCKEGLSGNSRYDAQRLVAFAASRGRIPGVPQVRTLASLLLELGQYLDLEDLRFTAVVIESYGLISDPALAEQHRMRYQIPTHALPEARVMGSAGNSGIYMGRAHRRAGPAGFHPAGCGLHGRFPAQSHRAGVFRVPGRDPAFAALRHGVSDRAGSGADQPPCPAAHTG